MTISPRQARERGRQLAAQARLGKLEAKKAGGGPTIETLVQAFKASHDWSSLAPKTRANWESYLSLHVLPALGNRAPESINRGDVKRWAGNVAKEAPTSANRSFEVLRRVWNWSLESELTKGRALVRLGASCSTLELS